MTIDYLIWVGSSSSKIFLIPLAGRDLFYVIRDHKICDFGWYIEDQPFTFLLYSN